MTPADNEYLEIQIIDEGLQIAISKNKNREHDKKFSNSMDGGTVRMEEVKIKRSEYDNKAKLYCSKFNKKISNPVFYKDIGYYKCIELNWIYT